MKSILIFITLYCTTVSGIYAQQLSGVATYQTQRRVDIKLDSSSVNNEMQKTIQEQLRKQFQKEYELSFNGSESLWKEVASIGKPQIPSGSGIQISVSTSGNTSYHHIKEELYVNQSDLLGKVFLVSDTLKKIEWKLEKETKNIGQYVCFKATSTTEYESKSYGSGEVEPTVKMKTKTTTAWYTLDIPVKHGPENYWGLPGLILEVNDGEMAMMCTKIVLNPKDTVVIEIPKKGKKVTGKEFEVISDSKSKEMIERYQTKSSKKGGGNDSFTIKIGN